MSEAAAIPREEQILDRLAELDLMLAERVHAKAMAAEYVDEINSLSRSYQRLARSVRQSLLAKARLVREREAAARRRREALDDDDFDLLDDLRDFGPRPPARPTDDLAPRVRAVCAAARPHLERERPDFDEADALQVAGLVRELAEYDDFLEVPVEVLVDRVMDMLGYAAPYGTYDTPAPPGGPPPDGSPPGGPPPRPPPPVHDTA